MDSLKAEAFLASDGQKPNFNYDGHGAGDGAGSGEIGTWGEGEGLSDGNGFIHACGTGTGHADGEGSIYKDGTGGGNGRGIGNGDVHGTGYGHGPGRGGGYGLDSIKAMGPHLVYQVDKVSTLLYHVHGNVAKGGILNSDLTVSPCYIVKGRDMFAHGETLQAAHSALMSKIFNRASPEERAVTFRKEFMPKTPYPVANFFSWHNKLTGSCEMGRRAFAQSHGIDLEHGTMTPEEFVALTKGAFGGNIISLLEQHYPS